MLIADIKAHGVMWIEADAEVQKVICRSFPNEATLATR